MNKSCFECLISIVYEKSYDFRKGVLSFDSGVYRQGKIKIYWKQWTFTITIPIYVDIEVSLLVTLAPK